LGDLDPDAAVGALARLDNPYIMFFFFLVLCIIRFVVKFFEAVELGVMEACLHVESDWQ